MPEHPIRERLDDLLARKEQARTPGSERAIQRQHDRGKMLARERIEYLLDEGSFRELDMLARQFELVIIDSPPVNVLADASMLAGAAKSTLFVVRWGRSTRESLQTAVQQLRRAGATLTGIVLGRVDLRRHRGYGYRDQAYYYGLAQKYYRSRP